MPNSSNSPVAGRIWLLMAIGFLPAATARAEDIHAMNKKLGRGINLGNALEAPKEGAWGVVLKPEYFKAIHDAGFNSVRLPVKWSAHSGKEPPYALHEEFARRVDWAIDRALENKLNIILNVHHYDEMNVDPDAHVQRLIAIWEQIAARYRERPDRVVFELLNEPNSKFTPEKWNAVIPKLLAVVRKTNPTRPVIIGPSPWNGVRGLDQLELPDDKNLIVTVHFYDPFEFTHQGASWVKDAAKWKGRKWTGSDAEQAAIRKALNHAAEWAKKHERPLFLGEFGAYQAADMESRARWTRFVVEEAEKLGFSWAYWEFCSGFGAYDPKAEAWRMPLKEALTVKASSGK